MSDTLHVHLESTFRNSSTRYDRFIVENSGSDAVELYFEIGNAEGLEPLTALNTAAIGLVNYGMSRGKSIHLHGPVSKILLENLEEFQCAWTLWLRHYKKIDITADHESIETNVPQSQKAICTFSCGVDAAFLVYRHYFKKAGRHHKDLATAVLVQGFDIPEDDASGMAAMQQTATEFLQGLDLRLHTVKTNLRRQWLPDWEMNFGAGCAAVLHLFSKNHSYGIIGGDEPYNQLVIPWGSNPITNHLLSSQRFGIIYDGNGFGRTQKVEELSQWHAARRNLKVCWEGPKRGENCGHCEKCLRTKLNFLASGSDIPACFAEGIGVEDIKSIRILNPVVRSFYQEIVLTAERRGIKEPWVEAVKSII